MLVKAAGALLKTSYKMSAQLPIKSSSRAGRFKKKLVSEDFLKAEAPLIEARMKPILEMFHQSEISSAELTAVYILTTLSYRYPGTWLGARRPQALEPNHDLHFPLEKLISTWEPNIRRRLSQFKTIGEVFQNFAFKATPLSVNRSILGWSNQTYGLELMFRIPRPEEVLAQQKQGRRCVTVILEKEKATKFILGQRDSLGFTMHDLIHADHFYHHNQSYQGQLGFYGFLSYCVEEKHFDELLKLPEFEAEFEYLISDMNAYAVHLFKCFKSALVHYHPRGPDFFSSWLGNFTLTQAQSAALLTLNSEDYDGLKDQVLLDFLEQWKQKS